MASIALVLGAGGAVGAAFHVGTVAALAEATGFDARSAGLIVGTSAGSGVAATLRAGFSPADHLARTLDEPMSAEGLALADLVPRERLALPDRPPFDPLAFLRPTSPLLVVPAFLGPGPVRPGLLAGLLPRGAVDSEPLGDRIRAVSKDRWPDQPTWICAVRLRDGKRVVFGRDDVDVDDIGTAVRASSAVPGFFTPVRIGDHEYLDGGLHSATNADLAARLGFDLVVVVSTMSATGDALGRTWNTMGRALHGRLLGREVAKVRDGGTPVLVIQPTRDDLRVMGVNPMASDRAPAVARRVRASVLDLLAGETVAPQVAMLRAAASDTAST